MRMLDCAEKPAQTSLVYLEFAHVLSPRLKIGFTSRMPPPPPPSKPDALSDIAFKNILDCRQTTDKQKRDYLSLITGAGTDSGQAEKLHDDFRKGKQLQGELVSDIDAIEGLGNLAPVEDIKWYSYYAYKLVTATLTYTQFRDAVELWIEFHRAKHEGRPPTSDQNSAAKMIEGKPIRVRGNESVWLFRNPTRSQNAFDGIIDEYLPDRLGLKRSGRRITLSFKASAVDGSRVRKPAFLDAAWSYLNFWDAGGRTRPILGTPSSHDGLEEVVGRPPTFRDLHAPVIEISAA
jgi:hypothetical protein